MNNPKQLWILAGGNGSGKTTFYNQYLAKHGIKFVNADLIAREIDFEDAENSSYQAATIAAKVREDLIKKGASFCFETIKNRFYCPGKSSRLQDHIDLYSST